MSDFERLYNDNPPRERVDVIDKHLSIEKPDYIKFVSLKPLSEAQIDLAIKLGPEVITQALRQINEKESAKIDTKKNRGRAVKKSSK